MEKIKQKNKMTSHLTNIKNTSLLYKQSQEILLILLKLIILLINQPKLFLQALYQIIYKHILKSLKKTKKDWLEGSKY